MSGSAPGRILAPGKLILIGEYAVLHGSPAVVMAVDRLAVLDWQPSGPRSDGPDLVAFARTECARLLGLAGERAPCRVDSSAFYRGPDKLGLGSSAATTVAAAASVFSEAGADLADPAVRFELWTAARRIHDAFQGVAGSGLDLAAAVFGGLLAMDPRRPGPERFFAWRPPAGLELVFAWTGRPASTASLVAAVERYRRGDPAGFADALAEMIALAEAFLGAAEPAAVLRAVDAYGDCLARLGRRARAPIAARPIPELVRAARELGGAAKPSGAGGGDFVLAAFPGPRAAAAFADRASRLGARPMSFAIHPRGVHLAPAPSGPAGRAGRSSSR